MHPSEASRSLGLLAKPLALGLVLLQLAWWWDKPLLFPLLLLGQPLLMLSFYASRRWWWGGLLLTLGMVGLLASGLQKQLSPEQLRWLTPVLFALPWAYWLCHLGYWIRWRRAWLAAGLGDRGQQFQRWRQQGEAAFKAGDYAAAIAAYQQAQRFDELDRLSAHYLAQARAQLVPPHS